jgi:uncharacterized protein
MDFERNNLDRAVSPYLRQHADNPVWWQEWKPEVLEHAKEENKVLFVSVGYATCHWCHVMARGAFSNLDVAAILNRDFVSIKVDREQRPDIDQYLMDFLVATTGNGGWPLNAFLTPKGYPFFAMTYAAATPVHGVPAFGEILNRVTQFYREKGSDVQPFELPSGAELPRGFLDDEGLAEVVTKVAESYDPEEGGLTGRQKFPPHCPNLFLLYAAAAAGGRPGEPPPTDQTTLATVRVASEPLRKSFDAITYRGLQDHVGGGFFRYCVDPGWQIPHFEKMLYDQAMSLWNLSLAARFFDEPFYRRAAVRTFGCLERDFRLGDLYVSSHDADTDHEEGATYLWDREELENLVPRDLWEAFERTFVVTDAGNFEGKNHLVMRDPEALAAEGLGSNDLDAVMAKLLEARLRRRQPEVDRKLITSWNALAGIALLQLDRQLGVRKAGVRAEEIFRALIVEHLNDGSLAHSSLEGRLQEDHFLSDYAALFLFATYLREDRDVDPGVMAALSKGTLAFRKAEAWFEAENSDFQPVPASGYDMPYPSSVSLAEVALLRYRIQEGDLYDELGASGAIQNAFLDIGALMAGGYFLEVESPAPLEWQNLPIHAMQKRGPGESYCHRGVCYMGLPNTLQGGSV